MITKYKRNHFSSEVSLKFAKYDSRFGLRELDFPCICIFIPPNIILLDPPSVLGTIVKEV
jgi:hypothetical protein